METEPKPKTPDGVIEKSELEAAKLKLGELGYILERTERVGGEEVLVYRRLKNLKYPSPVQLGIDDLGVQKSFDSLIQSFNEQVVLIDRFGGQEDLRDELYAQSVTLVGLNDLSRLRWNSLHRRLSLVSFLGFEPKDPIKSELVPKIEALRGLINKKKRYEYDSLSLQAKIELAEEVDRLAMGALDLLFSTVDKKDKKE